MTYEMLVHNFLIFCIGVLAVTVFFCLFRAVIGPRVADRMVGINMMGTQIIVMIAFVALLLGESGLVDIAIIYAVLSFLAVIILTKVFTGACMEKLERDKKKREKRTGEKVTEE
ncbi:MAG: sodium:proton antiporter [Lachnospiraceae bacterium]|nr:sodium:proton antiporter [Lachnospiraceae bacterium]